MELVSILVTPAVDSGSSASVTLHLIIQHVQRHVSGQVTLRVLTVVDTDLVRSLSAQLEAKGHHHGSND